MIAGRYSESEAQFRRAIQSDPNFVPHHVYAAQLYAATGRFDDAIKQAQLAHQVSGTFSADANGYVRLMEENYKEEFAHPSAVAFSFVILGNRDKAFEYLEKGYREEDQDLIQILRYPALDSIRSDPRYKDLMHRLGLPE